MQAHSKLLNLHCVQVATALLVADVTCW